MKYICFIFCVLFVGACSNKNCLVSFLQIIFLFCLNYDGIQQIFKGLGWIITIKYYFCSVKTIKT